MPFESEAHYEACVADPESFRQHLEALSGQRPELFPDSFAEGFGCHDKSWSIKPQLMLRRIELTATEERFQSGPPSCCPTWRRGPRKWKRLSTCATGACPSTRLAYVFGGDPMFWYRAEMALGRPSIVGSTVKEPDKLPQHLLADEKHTGPGAGGLCADHRRRRLHPGATVTDSASADALEAAYGEFAQEARELSPPYSPKTVCTDGWEGTQSAWRSLFPTVCIILCFLHSVLKIAERCARDRQMRKLVLDRVWEAYDSCTRAQFSQRLRRLREWATAHLPEGASG